MNFWAFLLAQSACYGLRYRFGAVRTLLTHALRMPNAKEVFFYGVIGLAHLPAPSENEVKNTSFLCVLHVCTRANA
jgi:hypothetical protein